MLSDHRACLKELGAFNNNEEANRNLPVAWKGDQLGIGLSASAKLSQIPYTIDHALEPDAVFPTGKMDADLQQVDLRKTNSWRLKLGEIPTNEMLEVQLVNSIAPFVLNNRLIHLMKKKIPVKNTSSTFLPWKVNSINITKSLVTRIPIWPKRH